MRGLYVNGKESGRKILSGRRRRLLLKVNSDLKWRKLTKFSKQIHKLPLKIMASTAMQFQNIQ